MPSKILKNLFLGSSLDSSDRLWLEANGITRILNCAVECPNSFPDAFTYHSLAIHDRPTAQIAEHLEHCIEFIHEGRSAGSVLVHCVQGVSRSASFVIAYLMKKEGMSLAEALSHVTASRPIACPNIGFLLQLREFEISLHGQASMTKPECESFSMCFMFSKLTRQQILDTHHECGCDVESTIDKLVGDGHFHPNSESGNFVYAYLHGFASTNQSEKAVGLATSFLGKGIKLLVPDLNAPSFEGLTYSRALGLLDELDREWSEKLANGYGGFKWRFLGASMGGYLAARWAELHPTRVDRLFLMCPAFAIGERWPKTMGQAVLDSWKEDGVTTFEIKGKPAPLKYDFYENAVMEHPRMPDPQCPIKIVHGTKDTVVSISYSQEFEEQGASGTRKLVVVEDDHRLLGSLSTIESEIFEFFDL